MAQRTMRRVHRSLFLMMLASLFIPALSAAREPIKPVSPQSVIAQLQDHGSNLIPQHSDPQPAHPSSPEPPASGGRRLTIFEQLSLAAMAMAGRYSAAGHASSAAPSSTLVSQPGPNQAWTAFLPLVLASERIPDITTAGGEVRSEDGTVVLTVPAGAVTEDVWVNLSFDGPYPPVSPDRRQGAMFKLTAFTRDRRPVTQFAQPLTLKVRHTSTLPDQPPPALFFFDSAQGEWQALPTTIDPTSDMLSATTTHFTDFAVLAPDDYGVELLSAEATADGTFIVTAVAQGISIDDVRLQVKDFSSGATVEAEPNADDSLFYVPAGAVGGNIGLHFSTTAGTILPFVGYDSLGAYGYWATTSEGFQPPFVGQKSGSWSVFATLIAAYLRNGGADVLGKADSELVHDWRGAPTQGFTGGNGQAGSVLMYNPNRCDAFQIKGDILGTYMNVSPEDWLGMPISDELTAPPDFYLHTGQPISYFEHGIITREPGEAFRDQNYYPMIGDVYASFTLSEPESQALAGTVTVRTMPVPGFPGSAGDFEVVGGENLGEFVALGNDTYRAPIAGEITDGQDYSFEVRIRPRSGDGPEGRTDIITIESAIPGTFGPIKLLPADPSIPDCTGGGGGFIPPRDTTPPVISDPQLFQNGTGDIAVQASVTDDRAVAAVKATVDGAEIEMPKTSGSLYAAIVRDLGIGYHTLRITAWDTANNKAYWPSETGVVTFKVEMSGYYGNVPWQGYSPDPVNTNIGNYVYQYTDLKVLSPGPDLVLERFYNAQSSLVGLFGRGWTSTFDMRVLAMDNPLMSGAQVRYADGRTVNFPAEGTGFASGEWVFDTLEREGDGYLLIRTDSTRYRFNAEGRLISIDDPSGNAVTLGWSGGQLSQIVAANGRSLTFTANDAGRVSQIDGPDGLRLNYNYEGEQLATVEDGTGATVTYRYDDLHGLVGMQTPEGHDFLAEQTFDDQGRVLHQRVGDAFINDFSYDDENHTTTLTDSYGRTITYRYDDDDRLIEQVDPLGHSERFEYNDDNQRTKATDRNGNVTSFEYNDNGDLVKTVDALGNLTASTYDDQHHLLTRTDALGHTTAYEYDAAGRQTAVIDALGQRGETRYNERGLLVEKIDVRGFSTTYAYDGAGNLTETRDALGSATTYAYDGQGRRTSVTDALGHTTTYVYDENGNLLAETDALGNSTTYVYDDNNNRVSEADALGHTTTYTYSHLDNLLTTTAADGGVTTVTYDDLNHRIAETDALGQTTRWGLDAAYRVISETNALGATTSFEYDPQGNRIAVSDARGFTTRYVYDALNRLTKVIDPLGGMTSYVYDAAGNRLAETNPRGAIMGFTYDSLGRVVERVDALGFVTTYAYDEAGNRISQTDTLGAVTRTEYDALNRPVKLTDALGNVTATIYDAVGNVIAVTDAAGFTSRTEYDALNRPTRGIDALGNVTSNFYDAVGNLTAQTDAAGFTTRTEYDIRNRPAMVIDALGGRTTTVYDLAGRRIREVDANNHPTDFAYDSLGRTVVVTDALGYTTQTRYDLVGNPVQAIDQNGVSTRTSYDALNRVIEQIDGRGFKTRLAYDAVGNLLTKTDALGFTTGYEYDLLNHRVRQTNALGFSTQFAYDALGRLISATDANGGIVTKTYDALGRVVKEMDAAGFATTADYNAVGSQISRTDANGFTTVSTYDGLRRPIETSDSLGVITQTAYDSVGNMTSQADGNGNATTFAYDGLRRQTRMSDADGDVTQFAYDAVGNRITVIDGNSHTLRFAFDARNQLISEADALGNTTRYAYDGVGRKVRVIDALGITTLSRYNEVGQLTAVVLNYRSPALANADTNVMTQYEYDAVGNRIKAINPNGHAVTFTPDAVGQLIAETDPLGKVTRYVFDGVGRQVQRTDANGSAVKSFYDRNDMLVRTLYPDGSSVTRSYDGNRNQLTVADRSGVTTRTYDARNRLISEETSRGRVAYTYDAADNRLSLRNADGTIVRYAYFADNQLRSVTNPGGSVTAYERDGIDQVLRQINGNNTISVNAYDAANRMLSTATNQTGGKLIASVAYAYDVVGQRTMATFEYRTGQPKTLTERYSYDALRRLIGQADSDGVLASYTYDPAGNRLTWQSSDDPRTPRPKDELSFVYTYDAADELLRAADTKNNALTTYRYDAVGNRLEQQTGRAGTAYVYDAENRLTAVQEFTVNGSGKRIDHEIATMLYDGDGRRVAKAEDHQVGGGGVQATAYVHDGLDPIATYETWHPQHANLYRADAGRILAMDSYSGGDTGQAHWFAQDGLGSTLALSKSDGQAEHHYSYDAFGGIKPENSANFGPHNDFTFTGQEYDEFIGLYHFHARTYDQVTGTWLTRDPYRGTVQDPQSLHRYGYVKGNPVNLVDLYGYAAQSGTYGKGMSYGSTSSLIDFITAEMRANASGRDVREIRNLNTTSYHADLQAGYQQLSFLEKLTLTNPIGSAMMGADLARAALKDAEARASALVWFGCLVADARVRPVCGAWDYKPDIQNRWGVAEEISFAPISQSGSVIFYYDIWSNINYGYTGIAAGFSQDALLNGAVLEQMVAKPGEFSDDPSDQMAIRIGIRLYNQFGANVTSAALLSELYSNQSSLNKYNMTTESTYR